MKTRRPVSTVRDYRSAPPSAGPARTTGAPAGATRGGSLPGPERDPDAPAHDAAARILPKQTLIAAAEDLLKIIISGRPNWRTEEGLTEKWILGRRAALLREIRRRGLTSNDRMP